MHTTEAMAAVWSPASRLAAMLRFEEALVDALARAGAIPVEAVEPIRTACSVERFDVAALEREAATAGNPVIPLVNALSRAVPPEERGYVHWGATSQDVIDTATMLLAREGLRLLESDLLAVGRACARLIDQHAATPMVARTLLQAALPTTFGLRAAHWLNAVGAATLRTRQLAESLPLQFGGAAGTLAAFGDRAEQVAAVLGETLGLAVPEMPWHTDRRPVAELAAALAIVSGSMAKIAGDVILLMASDVGEVREGDPAGSSAMPHKRNPKDAPLAVAAARLAQAAASVVLGGMAQELDRGAGAWQAEWDAIPDAFQATAGAVDRVRRVLEGLIVDERRMAQNLVRAWPWMVSEPLTLALAERIGRSEAFSLVAELTRAAELGGRDLLAVAREDARVRSHLSEGEVQRLSDPAGHLGWAATMARRALERFRAIERGDVR